MANVKTKKRNTRSFANVCFAVPLVYSFIFCAQFLNFLTSRNKLAIAGSKMSNWLVHKVVRVFREPKTALNIYSK